MQFSLGQKVRVVSSHDSEFNGREGIVTGLRDHGVRLSFVAPVLDGMGHDLCYDNDHGWFFTYDERLEPVKEVRLARRPPSTADDLRVSPQARTILRHLRKHGRVTPMKALVNYSISRLSSCIHELRKIGYLITTVVERDEAGHKFANYTMAKAN